MCIRDRPVGCSGCCPDECLDTEMEGCDPTPLPSPEPTPVPTPCSNLLEQCPLQCWEVDPNNQLPRCTAFNRPDCNELPFPTDIGCPDCCPDECLDTEMEGCDPTPLPSPLPTPEGPIECEIDVNIEASCLSSCSFDVCVERPDRMTMFYRGGGCYGTNFRRCPLRDPDPTPDLPNPDPCTCSKEELACTEWNNKNTCVDYNPVTKDCLLYTSPSPRDQRGSRMPSSA